MVTSIRLSRWNLIAKEKMESYCKGEMFWKDSVNDDLESLFENIRLGIEADEKVITYFYIFIKLIKFNESITGSGNYFPYLISIFLI